VTQAIGQVILRRKTSGVATVLIDCPTKINSLTAEVTDELEQALIEVERDSSVKAMVLVSGKPDTFLSGADLHEIMKFTDVEVARRTSSRGQKILDRLAALAKPTVVGINGVCLGGGLELALSCKRRIATTDAKTLLGLPEVRLGLIPGMGGTQRLPRLIGLSAALELILSAEPVSSARALELGLVDELVAPDDLLERCHKLALEMLGESPEEWARTSAAASAEDDKKREKLLAMAQRSVRIKTKGQYPASTRVLEVIKHGLANGQDAGQEMEAQVFAELSVTDTAKNLISLFFNTEFTRQTASLMTVKMQAKPVSVVGVIGSGAMGLAIAQLAAMSGRTVLFKPTNRNQSDNPYERLLQAIERSQSKSSSDSVAELKQHVKEVSSEPELAEADLIIEAIYEDEKLKIELFKRLEKLVKPDCTLASNTSSLSINKLAEHLADPGRFVGMHFFLPVDRMPLVEIISHRKTKREAIARAAGVVSDFNKIAIMVNDGPGFLVNRLLCTSILEAARLAQEGVPLNWIDDSAVAFGMAMGPLVVLDEVGLDVAFKVADALNSLGPRFEPPAVIARTKALGLVGKKTGSGIYTWDETGRKLGINERLTTEIGLVVADSKAEPDKVEYIAQRLILPMIDEAARCLEDKIVRKPREIDLAMVLGTGFPPFRGGPLKYADSLGINKLLTRLSKIYAEDGSGRHVAQLLEKMAAEGRRFYSRAADGDDA
jgi:3-hydroxyacyl-CoA dehydrogenase/enoyl-CoA hydratase/3-hydroxybutyryl-CoA epimerase